MKQIRLGDKLKSSRHWKNGLNTQLMLLRLCPPGSPPYVGRENAIIELLSQAPWLQPGYIQKTTGVQYADALDVVQEYLQNARPVKLTTHSYSAEFIRRGVKYTVSKLVWKRRTESPLVEADLIPDSHNDAGADAEFSDAEFIDYVKTNLEPFEFVICYLCSEKMTQKMIGDVLGVSRDTIKRKLTTIREKLVRLIRRNFSEQ